MKHALIVKRGTADALHLWLRTHDGVVSHTEAGRLTPPAPSSTSLHDGRKAPRRSHRPSTQLTPRHCRAHGGGHPSRHRPTPARRRCPPPTAPGGAVTWSRPRRVSSKDTWAVCCGFFRGGTRSLLPPLRWLLPVGGTASTTRGQRWAWPWRTTVTSGTARRTVEPRSRSPQPPRRPLDVPDLHLGSSPP